MPRDDQLLDAPLGYTLWIERGAEIGEQIRLWYLATHQREPASEDVRHGLWRVTAEAPQWGTLRLALQETWPLPAVPEPGPLPTPIPLPVPIPSVDVLKWRGDFLGDFIEPALMIGGMWERDRPAFFRVLDLHQKRGYTHIPLAVHNHYPRFPRWHWDFWQEPEKMRRCMEEIHSASILAVPVLHPKAGASISTHISNTWALWQAIRVAKAVVWGWEINDLGGEWANGTQQLDYLWRLQDGWGVPVFVHFTPERWSGWPSFDGTEPDKDEVQWLRRAKERGVVGLLYQDSPDQTEDEVIARACELPSPHGWRPGIAGRVVDGAGMAFILFEYGRSRPRNERLGARAVTFDTVSGFGNGGPST